MGFLRRIFGFKPTVTKQVNEKSWEHGEPTGSRVYSGKGVSMFETLTYNFKSLFERSFSLNLGIQVKNIGIKALTASKVNPIAVFKDLNAAVRNMPGIVTELTLDQEDVFTEQMDKLSNQQLMRLGNNLNELRTKNFYGCLKNLRDSEKDTEVKKLYQFNLDLLDAIERVVSDRLGVEEVIEPLTISEDKIGQSLLEEEGTVPIKYDTQLMSDLQQEAINQKALNRAHQQQEVAVRLLKPADLIDTLKQSNDPVDIFNALSKEVIKLSNGLAVEGEQLRSFWIYELSQIKDLAKDNDLKGKLEQLIQDGWPQAINQLLAKEAEKIAREEKKGNKVDYTLKRLLENNKLVLNTIIEHFNSLVSMNLENPKQQAIEASRRQLTIALNELLTPIYSKSSNDPSIFKSINDELSNPSETERKTKKITLFGKDIYICEQFDTDAHRWQFECKEGRKGETQGKAVPLKFALTDEDKIKTYEQLLKFFGYDDRKEEKDPENQKAVQRFEDFTLLATQRCEAPILKQLKQAEYFGAINYKTTSDEENKLTIAAHTKNENTESGKRIFGKTAEGTFYVIMEGKQDIPRLATVEQSDIPSNPLTTKFEYRVKFDYNEKSKTFSADASQSNLAFTI